MFWSAKHQYIASESRSRSQLSDDTMGCRGTKEQCAESGGVVENGPGGDHPSSDDEQGGYHLEIIHHVAGGSLGAFLLIGLIIGLYAFRHYWRKYKAQIIQRAVNEANVNNIEQFQLA